MRYRKRPVEIDAVQWNGRGFSEYPEWINQAIAKKNDEVGSISFVAMHDVLDDVARGRYSQLYECYVFTLEGKHEGQPGDMVIRGVKGEIYFCKPDIFAITYEKVDP